MYSHKSRKCLCVVQKEEGLDLQKKEEDECLATESKKEDDDES